MNAKTFDRTADVSKLIGCNTRGVEYRWDTFLDSINIPAESKVLDFGAGSLRDSNYLCELGFDVTSLDLDKALMESYAKSYRWRKPPKLIAAANFYAALKQLGSDRFF